MAQPVIPPLPACGERIEVRGFDLLPKNPHPTLSLSKGEATEGCSIQPSAKALGYFQESLGYGRCPGIGGGVSVAGRPTASDSKASCWAYLHPAYA